MSLESKVRAYVGKFRESKVGFQVPAELEHENTILPNPEARFNPLGGPVPSVSVVVISDTHFHIQGRETFDRTAILPTTKAMNKVRRHIGQKSANWHSEVRPSLYNNALLGWPSAVGEFLESGSINPTENVLLIHGGDMGDDALNQAELGIAITTTQDVMAKMAETFSSSWGSNTRVQSIYAVGNHDADHIAWPKNEKTRQIQWFYEKLGITEHPSCFLQEIQDPEKDDKGKALLVIDTNLLDEAWLKGVAIASANAIEKLLTKVDMPQDFLEAIAANPKFWDKLKELEADQELTNLLKDSLLYPMILRHKSEQEEIITEAHSYQDLTIVGHKPKETLDVSKSAEGNVTIISGDVHFAYDSGNEGNKIKLPKQTTKNGNPIRRLIVGGATRGAMGIEIPGKATAIMLKIDSQEDVEGANSVFEIAQTI